MSRRVRRQRARVAAGVAPGDQSHLPLATWLLVALAVPRIARILYPAIWVEDDLLLESSLDVSKGMRPFPRSRPPPNPTPPATRRPGSATGPAPSTPGSSAQATSRWKS